VARAAGLAGLPAGRQAAALKCQPRDRWIGWPPVLHYQRLHLIANNCRFLILPEVPSRPPQTQTLPWSWGAAIVCYHETESPMPNSRIEPLKKVLAIDPNDDVAWFGLGKAYMDDGNFEEAAMALRQCVTVKPAYSAAYFALAQSLHTLHRLEECRTVITTGIEVSTKNGDAMVTKNLEALKSSLPQ
jgi:tetratricopeptide (TPR) repeat protein